jgi:predicted ATPase
MDMLADYLEDKQLLLVLDNCEHLLDSCAVLAGELFGGGCRCRIRTPANNGHSPARTDTP